MCCVMLNIYIYIYYMFALYVLECYVKGLILCYMLSYIVVYRILLKYDVV